jgi:adenylate cyclase
MRPWHRFHVRATVLFGAPALLLMVGLGIASYRFAVDDEVEILRSRIRGIAVGLARGFDGETIESIQAPVDARSPAFHEIQRRCERVAEEEPEVKSIYIFRRTDQPQVLSFVSDWVRAGMPGQIGEEYDASSADHMMDGFEGPIVERRIYSDAWGRNLSGYAPIRDRGGRVVAIVGVDMSARRVVEAERRSLIATGSMYGVAIVLFALGGVFLGRSLRRPFERIRATTAAIAAGRLDARANVHRRDELGLIAQRIDEMAAQLEERERLRAIFGRYVSEDVARQVLASNDDATLRGDERVVTVLFTDIRRYSTIAEGLAPDEVLDLLNAYLAAMTDVVDAHDGCVIEILGDGILAVFGTPKEIPDHAAKAVRCAMAMRARLAELNEQWIESGLAQLWRGRGIDRLGARYGVHTGTVVAGNIGAGARTKYAVIGHAVNLAVELEALNEDLGTSLLCSESTLRLLPNELASEAETKGAFPVRGHDEPLAVHAL